MCASSRTSRQLSTGLSTRPYVPTRYTSPPDTLRPELRRKDSGLMRRTRGPGRVSGAVTQGPPARGLMLPLAPGPLNRLSDFSLAAVLK